MTDDSRTIPPARYRDRRPTVRRRPSGDLACTLGAIGAPTAREAASRGQHDLTEQSTRGKSISYAYRCQRNVSAADIALAKKPRLLRAWRQFTRSKPYLRRRLWEQNSNWETVR